MKQQSLAALLPNVSGAAFQASLTENLAALGFQPGLIPGFNTSFVGPFKNFDARVSLAQTILDLSAIRNYQGAALVFALRNCRKLWLGNRSLAQRASSISKRFELTRRL
jgi:hypothetical protein